MAFSCELLRTPSLKVTRAHNLILTGLPAPAGSSSPPSIMNGASSEAIARAGGQYGSVPPFSVTFHGSPEPRVHHPPVRSTP
jgi:hypothetical protein